MMIEKNRYIGRTYPIQDAVAKACGEQIYAGDLKLPKMLHAKILFSTVAHAHIRSIDTSKAEELEGVVKIFTHLNSPEKKFNSYHFFAGQELKDDERLFTDKVRFFGDRVAGIVAETEDIAKKALKLIDVEYDELPVAVSTRQALSVDAPDIHVGGNLIDEKELNVGRADDIINGSSLTFKNTISTQKVHHGAMEPHVCLARYKMPDEMTIYTPCQSAFAVRNVVAQFLEMNYCSLRVVKTTMGGSFGGKQHVILELIAAFFAKETRSNVRLCYSRTDSILSTITGTAIEMEMESAVNEEGMILATQVKTVVDSGSYLANSVDLSIAAGKKLFRTYNIPNLNYKAKTVYTNTPTAGGFRGWGAPQITTGFELHVESMAKKMGMDSISFRLKNLVKPYDEERLSQLSLGNARIRECLTLGAEAFDWSEKKKTPRKKGRIARGTGLACGGHVNGFYGKIQDCASMILKMNEDGSFILNTGSHDQGCGTVRSFMQIVAEVIDVDIKKVKVLEADTQRSPYDTGTFASRVTYVSGKCAYNVSLKIRDQILETAARYFNRAKTYMAIKDGMVHVKGDPEKQIDFGHLATLSQSVYENEIIALETYSNVSNPGAYAAHFAEVEVDTQTGLVRVIDYLASHDVGKAINRGMVEAQIQGGVQMGIGYALTEEIKTDAAGNPKSKNFSSYHLINAPDMPTVKTLILEFGEDDGPFGAKSVGEIAIVPVIATVMNAVNDALGTNLCHAPLTPEKIIAAIH
ncbi:MAG: molybdopterin-dependent oxidoreductase [Desulfobacterium sp.]